MVGTTSDYSVRSTASEISGCHRLGKQFPGRQENDLYSGKHDLHREIKGAPFSLSERRLRGDLITAYKYLLKEKISDSWGLFNLTEEYNKI